jgi:tetratricopeptide (TPR) repeat protein
MKKIIIAISLIVCMASCNDKLDITPKGETTLDNLTDLECLLNNDFSIGKPMNDLGIICNEDYGASLNVPLTLTQTSTNNYAWLAYDAKVDRANLTSEDTRYSLAYKYINYMNTIIDKVPNADGTEAKKSEILAEAHIMRGYLHWLLVNIYAKQYDESTAATDGGIAYVTDLGITDTKEKQTVAEVYKQILADCSDENINALPNDTSDVVRGDCAWGNAVRAKVLMQMKRYAEALPYAVKALELNGTIEDRSTVLTNNDWILQKQATDNYVFMGSTMAPFSEELSLESATLFEPGDYVKDYAYINGDKSDSGGGDDDGGDDESEDSKAAYSKIKKAAADSDSTDDGDEGTDDEGGSTGSETKKGWNTVYGLMLSGVSGSYMYFGMQANVNEYGITSDRMYYTAAECYIRTGKISEGMDLINKVRKYRIDADHYAPLTATTEQEAMQQLQKAKWIECISTYENFFDCKRWNTEAAYKRTITRTIPDVGTYTLAPDSPLWIFPFPLNATRRNKTLTQNY